MYTIASLIDSDAHRQTKEIWSFLEEKCRLSGIKIAPFPHFSWQSALDYHDINLNELVESISMRFQVFELKSSGLGIFTGENPIIYLPLIKTKTLLGFHEMIWAELAPYAIQVNNNYSPENWMPHITIAYGDITLDRLECALKHFAFHDLTIPVQVNNLAVLSKFSDTAKIDLEFYFN